MLNYMFQDGSTAWTPTMDSVLNEYLSALPANITTPFPYISVPANASIDLSPETKALVMSKLASTSTSTAGTMLRFALADSSPLSLEDQAAIRNRIGTTDFSFIQQAVATGAFNADKGIYSESQLQTILSSVTANKSVAAGGYLYANLLASSNTVLTSSQRATMLNDMVTSMGTAFGTASLNGIVANKAQLNDTQKSSLVTTLLANPSNFTFTSALTTLPYSEADTDRILAAAIANPSSQLAFDFAARGTVITPATEAYIAANLTNGNSTVQNRLSTMLNTIYGANGSRSSNATTEQLDTITNSLVTATSPSLLGQTLTQASYNPTMQDYATTLAERFFEVANPATSSANFSAAYKLVSDETKQAVEQDILSKVGSATSAISAASSILSSASTGFVDTYLSRVAANNIPSALNYSINITDYSQLSDEAVASISTILTTYPTSGASYSQVGSILNRVTPGSTLYNTALTTAYQVIESDPWSVYSIVTPLMNKPSATASLPYATQLGQTIGSSGNIELIDATLYALEENNYYYSNPQEQANNFNIVATTLIAMSKAGTIPNDSYYYNYITNLKANSNILTQLPLNTIRELQAIQGWN